MSSQNIHPVFENLIQRATRETKAGHRGIVIWLTGLSGSGKSTIAAAVERELFSNDFQVRVLDGDNVRTGLNSDLGFSLTDRAENIRRIAEVAKLFSNTGVITLCSFVSPTRHIRELAKTIIESHDFREVYVDADLQTCELRDVKGLYAKARTGQIKGFTGIDSPYESPRNPDLILETGSQSVAASAKTLSKFIKSQVQNNSTQS